MDLDNTARLANEILATGQNLLDQHDIQHKEFLISSNDIEKLLVAREVEQVASILLNLPEVEDYLLKD